MADFSNKVIYQIYPKSFKDSNGDGIGDLRGVAEKLDYLKDLGVDYLWLTPFFVSPQRDNGYDVADYRNIDPMFGTMEDLDNLIAEGEKRNIGLMFDMVFNHTSTSHEWFRRALAGEKKYQDYYIFKEGAPDQPPTNWQSKFGGSAWEYVSSLGKWYLHLFDVTQADLNWKNPEVREELKEVIRFWKAKGVKGFRFDVVNLISKPEIWEDDFEGDGRKFYTDGPYVHEYLKELVRDTGIEDYVTVGEMSSTTLEHCIRYSGAEEKELSMCFNFHHLKVDYKDGNKWELMEPDYMELKVIFEKWQMGMQRGNAWNALFWCNHDQPRIVSRFGNEGEYWKESAKMLAGMIHLMRGTPYIYQGEEIGMTNPHYTSIEQYADVESRNYYEILLNEGKTKEEALEILAARSRDNSRTPMQWTDERYCGFSDTKPWIPVSDNFEKINVKKQKQDRDSILEFYKKLIMLRKEKEVIARGNIEFMEVENAGVLAYTSFSSSGKRMLTRREIEVFSFARSCTLSNLYLVNDLSALWSLPCPHRHFHRYTPWHPQKWSLLFFPGCMHNQWLLPKNRRSWWSSSGPSHSRWNAPGGGRGGHWYMPSTIPLSPDARSLWKSGASPVRWLPLPSRCHWQHGQAGWHCCKVPQSFEEVLHDAHRALSEAVRLRSGNVKIPPCLVHSLRPARPDAEVLSHSNGQELHGFVFSFDHLPFLLLCCL